MISWHRSIALALAATAFLTGTNAHGYLSLPKAQYKVQENYTSFDRLLAAKDVGESFVGRKWDSTPAQNARVFTDAFRAQTKFATLRDFTDTFVTDCANTRLDVPAVDVSQFREVKYQNDERRMGVVDTHHGPCEIWIGKTRVFQTDDCRAHTTAYPAAFSVDYSVCKGECVLTFYLLAVHEPDWQMYKQCVPTRNEFGVAPPSIQASSQDSSRSSRSGSGAATADNSGDDVVSATPAPATPVTSSNAVVASSSSTFFVVLAFVLGAVAAQS